MAKNPKPLNELTHEELLAFAIEQEKTIGDLKAALKNEQEAAEKNIKALEAELKAANNAASESGEKDSVISDLMKKVSELEASNKVAGNAPEVITHKKEKYIVRIPSFRHNGVKCTVDTLKENPKLIDELIEMKSGVIEKISE